MKIIIPPCLDYALYLDKMPSIRGMVNKNMLLM
jgi:hypothetical protein